MNDVSATMLAVYKRIPLEKGDLEIPLAEQIRPIDIHSIILRIISSTSVQALRPWLDKVIHATQYSSYAGAMSSITRLSVWVEVIAQKKCTGLGSHC